MINTNITNFRKDIFRLLENTIKYNEPLNISTKNGSVIVLSESEYQGLIETLILSSMPEMKEKLIKGIQTPLSECVAEDSVQW